jgi:tetratricopeptide (TPR) repeat protein
MKSCLGKLHWAFLLLLMVCSSCMSPQRQAELYYKAGIHYSQSGYQSDAIIDFSHAIELNPKYGDAYFARGTLKLALQHFEAAINDYDKAIELNPSDEPALYYRGLCKFGLKDAKGAIADFSAAIELDPGDANAYEYRGRAQAILRDRNDALNDFNKVVKLDPQEATAYRNRAAVEVMQKECEKAQADISKAIELDDHDAFSYNIRGHIKITLKDFPGALVDFNKVVELTPKDGAAYANRGSVKLQMDDFEGANADLEMAFQLTPNSALVFVNRGFLKEKSGDPDGALADFNRAVELAPQVPEPYACLGLLQYNLSQWTPALENIRKALEQDPAIDDARPYVWLIRSQTGEENDANIEMDAYVKSLQGEKTNDWAASVGRFLAGNLSESNFLSQATTTAKRPSAIISQVCESFYFAGMKHKLAGDKQQAIDLFQKCLNTGNDNNFGYLSARVEMNTNNISRAANVFLTQPNLTGAMSDDQILQTLGLDPAKLTAHVTQGKDGHSTAYSTDNDQVTITRSMVTGVVVIRSRPQGTQTWSLH